MENQNDYIWSKAKGGRILHAWKRKNSGHRQTFQALCNPDLRYKLDKGHDDTRKCEKCLEETAYIGGQQKVFDSN